MVWVRSEYAGELAVVSAWLSVVLPWNVTYSGDVAGGRLLFVRFPFLQFRYGWGVEVAEANGLRVDHLLGALALQQGQTLHDAYLVWLAGAVVVAAAFALSLAWYVREGAVESGPVDPVPLMGGLLLVAGLLLSVANYLVVTRGFPGVPLPVGTVFLLALGAILLTAERVDPDEGAAESGPPDPDGAD